ncbi:MAG: hypothetical protein H7Y11_14995, partial [Armatimonadetes bacterium]|nr:hypothetical protein [Anaerolineae bacterium]
ANINATPVATQLNFNLPVPPERAVLDSSQLISAGQYDIAIATLSAERAALGDTYNPYPAYFEAVALANQGDYQDAQTLLVTLEAGLAQFSEVEANLYRPIVELAFGEVIVIQARAAMTENRVQEAGNLARTAILRLQDAVNLNPRLLNAYLLLAEAQTLLGDYQAGIRALQDAQLLPELANDPAIIVARGQVFLADGRSLKTRGLTENAYAQLERAEYEAYYALYLNPFLEAAHQVRIEAALLRDQPGLAVQYSQNYLLYFEDNLDGLRLLAQARLQENNPDLAYAVLDQALGSISADAGTVSTVQDTTLIDLLVERAGLYSSERRYGLALADYNQALLLAPTPGLQAQRMTAAYAAGDFDTALTDATTLLGSGALPDAYFTLMQARIRLDRARSGDLEANREALALLTTVSDALLSPALAAVANEYRARAHLTLGEVDAALTTIDAALLGGDSGSRRYLRGQIYQEQSNFVSAARDYEWVLTWAAVYGYAFADDVRERLAEVRQAQLETALTPTAIP